MIRILLFITVIFLDDVPPELERVRQQFNKGKVLHAQMIHVFEDSYTGEVETTQALIWISKEKYKIRADEQTVLVDGRTSRVYNERQNKLVISQYEPEEDDFAPSRFFSGEDEIFKVTKTERKQNMISITLQSEDPFEMFTMVTILLDENLTPVEINAVDQMDNYMRTTFTDTMYLEYSDTFFDPDFPQDAEIIDLRR